MSAASLQRAQALSSLSILAAFAAVPSEQLWPRVGLVVAALLVAELSLRAGGHARAIPWTCAALVGFWIWGLPWQLVMALAIAVAWLTHRRTPEGEAVRPALGALPLLGTFMCGAVTPFALLGWVWLMNPDLTRITDAIPRAPFPLLVAGGVAFALLNATLEEWIWRGVVQAELSKLFSLPFVVVLQALSFGSIHAHGFPDGAVGVALAAAWAVLLGVLRVKSGGILAPTLAHVVADASIACIVLGRVA